MIGLLLYKLLSRILVVGILLGLAAASYAYAASNTVPASKAGDGSATISGYTASNIHYTLNATSPQNIDSVILTLSVAPASGSTMKIQLSSGGPWYTCTNSGTSLTCTTTSPQATAVSATQLTLVVAD